MCYLEAWVSLMEQTFLMEGGIWKTHSASFHLLMDGPYVTSQGCSKIGQAHLELAGVKLLTHPSSFAILLILTLTPTSVD